MTSTIACGLVPALERGSAVICVPVLAADRQTLATVRRVIEHTDSADPILLAGSAVSIEKVVQGLPVEMRDDKRLRLVVQEGSDTAAVNRAALTSHPADMALVAPGCLVASEWLPRLRAAATSDSIVASATALSIGGGGVELFDTESNEPAGLPTRTGLTRAEWATALQQGVDVTEEAAHEVRRRALTLRPRIGSMGPGCVYIRRATWELTGPLDDDLALAPALEKVATRTIALGLIHVAADDVLVVSHKYEAAPTPRKDQAPGCLAGDPARGEAGCLVQETIVRDESGPLHRSLSRARTALRGLSVTIDGRSLTARVGGTQTYVIELILALSREREMSVRVLIASDISPRATDALATAPEVELLTYDEAIHNPSLTDVVHRPQQVFTPDDLALLRLVGRRIVIGQQDLIAYHNNAYHPDVDAWRSYRRTTRLALAGADQVIFFSDHARRDALAEDLLPEERAHVVGIGAETFEPSVPPGDPPGSIVLEDPFLLCIGADYAHKNRSFAIELLAALRALGWRGRLVLAGAHVPYGSSRARETKSLTYSPDIAPFIVDLGPVDDASKQWLYAHACALLYPTLYEGFGLIPLEAARAGIPCLFAAQASLSEVAPDAATLVPWDAPASALAVLPLLSEGPARDHHLAKLHSHSTTKWDVVARDLHAVYEQALAAPPSVAAPRVWQELDREDYIVRLDQEIASLKLTAQEYQDAYHSLVDRVSFGLPLIDSGGLLSVDQQRALMRIASRGRLGALALAPLGAFGRVGASHRRGPS